MAAKGPATDAVFATYNYPYEPLKPCQNTIVKVVFSGEGLKNRVWEVERGKPAAGTECEHGDEVGDLQLHLH